MLSLDPFTVTNRGYPLLLQTGETYDGEPLHDRQHPHDFSIQVALLYQREITPGLAWSVYAAPSGEPGAQSSRLHAPPIRNGQSRRAARPPLGGIPPT